MKKIVGVLIVMMMTLSVFAQHEHHEPQPKKKAAPQKKVIPQPEKQQPKQQRSVKPSKGTTHGHMHIEEAGSDMQNMEHEDHEMNMSHAFSRNLPMNRNGSGTGWLPDASPMYGSMVHSKKWMYMFHGNIFLRYNNQDVTNKGVRGDSKFDVPNWLMAMGQRPIGEKGLFRFSAMLSADAIIAGGSGYPLLFQSGETWKGKALIDRQHPHDLFSELSVSYTHSFTQKIDLFAYIGYPGEPALGPVAFMHRPSALYNPDAPLSHHWVDATHITFGVATLGFRFGKFKIEGSSFTGREPDENRYNFDKPRFDSRSARLSFNPTANWALQVSQAYIKSPEPLHAGEDVNRTTASAIYSKPIAKNVLFNAAGVWGMNKTAGHDGEHAALVEASLAIRKLAVYTRYEMVQKSVEELALNELLYGHDAIFPVNALTLGAAYDVLEVKPLRLSAGAQFSVYSADDRLDNLYGNNPMAAEIYLRLYPMQMR